MEQQARALGQRMVHLQIGECIITEKPMVIATVLGSCVSATFFHKPTGMSAIFHALLPSHEIDKQIDSPCKYADLSIEAIAKRFTRRSIRPRDVEVKLFGGAFTMNGGQRELVRSIVDVGSRNVETARASLAAFGFHISREDTLGGRGRKLFFFTESGDVWVRKLGTGEVA